MNSTAKQNIADRRRVRGQGMTEYIIIVALIAIASIAAVSFFGGVVKEQFIAMGQELGGNDGVAPTVAAPEGGATTLREYVD